MLQRFIIAIAICFSGAIVVSSGWGQSRPPGKDLGYVDTRGGRTPAPSGYSYDNNYYDTPAYSEAIKKSVEAYKSATERAAIGQILADLETKSYREILGLKLAPDVCQEIACRAVSTDTARRYVEAYANMRVADDAHQTALRNAAAAERNTFIAAGGAIISLLSLSISALSYRRTFTSAKSSVLA